MSSLRFFAELAVVEVYALVLLRLICRRQLRESGNKWLSALTVLHAMYLAALFYMLLSPTYMNRRFHFSTARLNLVPFRAFTDFAAHPLNFIGNLVLFLPMGFYVAHWYHQKNWGIMLLRCAVDSALLALIVETVQLFTYRVSDIDDIILNAAGGFLGGALCIIQHKLRLDRTRYGRKILPKRPHELKNHTNMQPYMFALMLSFVAGLFIVNAIITMPRYTQYAYGENTLKLEAQNVILVSTDDGNAVFAANSEDEIAPASTLKMLAAIVALDTVDADTRVTTGNEIYLPALDASRMGLKPGMDVSVRDLLSGLLLPSGADAAYALAVHCGRIMASDAALPAANAIDVFRDAMNAKAVALDANDTMVINIDGYDAAGQHSTASDLLRIAKAFISYPVLREVCSLPANTITYGNGETLTVVNTNKMLDANSPYFNDCIAGIKTGTTDKAGNCLVSTFDVDGRQYLCCVMHSSYDGKFTDTQTMYDLCRKLAVN